VSTRFHLDTQTKGTEFVWDNVGKNLTIGYGGRSNPYVDSRNKLNVACFDNSSADFPVPVSSTVATIAIGGPGNPIDNPPNGLSISHYGGPGTAIAGTVYGNYEVVSILGHLDQGATASPIALNVVMENEAGPLTGLGGLAYQPVSLEVQMYNNGGATAFGSEWLVYDISRQRADLLMTIANGKLVDITVDGAVMTVHTTQTNASEGITGLLGDVVNVMGSSPGPNDLDGVYNNITLVGGPSGTSFTIPNLNGVADGVYTDTYLAVLPGQISMNSGNVMLEAATARFSPPSYGGYMGGIVLGAAGYWPADFAILIQEDPQPKTYYQQAIKVRTKNGSMNLWDLWNQSTPDRTTGTWRMRNNPDIQWDMNTSVDGDYSTFVTPFKITAAGICVMGSQILSGTGSPEGAVSGSPGDLYVDQSGGAGTTLYVKESGAATDTGWVAK
jgi:hypothetical protein